MLYKETVPLSTLELLNRLMQIDYLTDFILVGGTALALQLGHRKSVDIDLFSQNFFDSKRLSEHLQKDMNLQLDFIEKNTIKGEINGIKTDFITHAYSLVQPPLIADNIRMADKPDIAAMKLNAVSGNGTRLKDFIDIAYLSSSLSLKQMLDAYGEKYKVQNPVIPLKALAYYNDINFKEPVHLTRGKLNWNKIKDRIGEMIQFPEKIFPGKLY